MVLVWAWRRRQGRPVAVLAAIVVLVAVLLSVLRADEGITRHAGSITSAGDVSNLERFNRWTAAIEMTRARPWLGFGLASYPFVYPEYRRKTIVTELAYQHMSPHSEFFRLFSENGVVGFLAACWFLAAAFLLGVRVIRRSPDPLAQLLALAVMAGLGTFCIHGFFRTYIDLEKVAVAFWAGFGTLAGLGRGLDRARP
jgi:O-antigen ligase